MAEAIVTSVAPIVGQKRKAPSSSNTGNVQATKVVSSCPSIVAPPPAAAAVANVGPPVYECWSSSDTTLADRHRARIEHALVFELSFPEPSLLKAVLTSLHNLAKDCPMRIVTDQEFKGVEIHTVDDQQVAVITARVPCNVRLGREATVDDDGGDNVDEQARRRSFCLPVETALGALQRVAPAASLYAARFMGDTRIHWKVVDGMASLVRASFAIVTLERDCDRRLLPDTTFPYRVACTQANLKDWSAQARIFGANTITLAVMAPSSESNDPMHTIRDTVVQVRMRGETGSSTTSLYCIGDADAAAAMQNGSLLHNDDNEEAAEKEPGDDDSSDDDERERERVRTAKRLGGIAAMVTIDESRQMAQMNERFVNLREKLSAMYLTKHFSNIVKATQSRTCFLSIGNNLPLVLHSPLSENCFVQFLLAPVDPEML